MTTVEIRPSILLAGDAMTPSPVTVSTEDSVLRAWALMTRHGVRHLLVIDRDLCLGVVDDRTIFAQWPSGPGLLRQKPVAAVMRVIIAGVRVDTELRHVAAIMLRECLDAVPVVDETGGAIGIITSSDILRALATSPGGHDDVRRGA